MDPLDEEYARAVYKNKERWIQLHWYYFPDSHDSWVSTELPVDPPEILYGNQHPTQWMVISFRFSKIYMVVHDKYRRKLFNFLNN